jgi:thiamine biosynthesis lipoprotein
MGMAVSVDVRDMTDALAANAAIDEVFEWLRSVDETFSTYRADSEVSRLGRGVLSLQACSDDVRTVLELCEEARGKTAGFFDARAGDGRSLDPSGMVKGWAVEEASSLLVASGCVVHCINAGGDVRMRGEPDPGRMWNIGIVHPFDRGSLTTVVSGNDLAVATSGTSERGYHVIDPHTGVPATSLASVTVVGAELTFTDAYATAALAMGLEATTWLGTLPGHEAYVVDAGGRAWQTPGFGDYVNATVGDVS